MPDTVTVATERTLAREPVSTEFRNELEELLNRHSIDNRTETPDFLLADFLIGQIDVFTHTMGNRDNWRSK